MIWIILFLPFVSALTVYPTHINMSQPLLLTDAPVELTSTCEGTFSLADTQLFYVGAPQNCTLYVTSGLETIAIPVTMNGTVQQNKTEKQVIPKANTTLPQREIYSIQKADYKVFGIAGTILGVTLAVFLLTRLRKYL